MKDYSGRTHEQLSKGQGNYILLFLVFMDLPMFGFASPLARRWDSTNAAYGFLQGVFL